MEKEMLTAKEAAEYLNLNDKIIYRLVREGRLPGARITGKWTFSRFQLREWIESHSLKEIGSFPLRSEPRTETALFIAGSDDLLLGRVLAQILHAECPELLTFYATLGSLEGIRAIKEGTAHLVGVHLYHPQSGQYNLPYLGSFPPKERPLMVNLAYRTQGWMVRPKGPPAFGVTADLFQPGIRLINRERGSGTRVLLDYLMAKDGIDSQKVAGYANEVYTHLEVGLAILKGDADVGLGIQPVAESLGLRFLPITTERYDLLVPQGNLSLTPVRIFFNLLHSGRFLKEARALPGYDMRDSGKILH
ncbi:MAG: helix-turn-helix domain-containing protein [Syntrophobacterales bacterium]|nr:MAG: helix-turn-helix domain-containing protein [Syntrophobacterales bacterium]